MAPARCRRRSRLRVSACRQNGRAETRGFRSARRRPECRGVPHLPMYREVASAPTSPRRPCRVFDGDARGGAARSAPDGRDPRSLLEGSRGDDTGCADGRRASVGPRRARDAHPVAPGQGAARAGVRGPNTQGAPPCRGTPGVWCPIVSRDGDATVLTVSRRRFPASSPRTRGGVDRGLCPSTGRASVGWRRPGERPPGPDPRPRRCCTGSATGAPTREPR